MSMTTKLILSCLGIFLGGITSYYQVHATQVLDARFYISITMAGLAPLGAYFVGLSQKSPWNGNGEPKDPQSK